MQSITSFFGPPAGGAGGGSRKRGRETAHPASLGASKRQRSDFPEPGSSGGWGSGHGGHGGGHAAAAGCGSRWAALEASLPADEPHNPNSGLSETQHEAVQAKRRAALRKRAIKAALAEDFFGNMELALDESWAKRLGREFDKPYWLALQAKLRREAVSGRRIFPPAAEVFNAFGFTPFDKVKVVILGQDPYHGPGQAHGLCFSVRHGVPPPPSLKNIFKELEAEYESFAKPDNGCLESWAKQGVLLLNSMLTVRARDAGSHQKMGWEQFTDAVIAALNKHRTGLVFLLWGSYAQSKGKIVSTSKHCVLKSVHPSPLSAYRGYFGCNHFGKANAFLAKRGLDPIDWRLPNVDGSLPGGAPALAATMPAASAPTPPAPVKKAAGAVKVAPAAAGGKKLVPPPSSVGGSTFPSKRVQIAAPPAPTSGGHSGPVRYDGDFDSLCGEGMAAIASGVHRAHEEQAEAKVKAKKEKHTFNDISTRASVFRDKLIEEFRLLENLEQTQSSHAPVFDAGSLFPAPDEDEDVVGGGGGSGSGRGVEMASLDARAAEAGVLEPGGNRTFTKVLKETPHQMVKFKHFKRRPDKEGEFKKFQDKRMTRLKNVNSPPLGLWAHWIVTHHYFEWLILGVILMNAVVLGVQAELSENESEYWLTLRILYFLDLFALYVFLLEIGLKWIDSFMKFWQSGWNVFDFLVTLLSAVPEVLPFFLSGSSASSRKFAVVAKQLRLLRVLRALKLLVHFTGIRIIVETTLQAFNSMSFIMILLGLVAYIYAVAGIYLFAEYTESERSDLQYQEKFRGMGNALITLFQLITLDQWYLIHQDVALIIPRFITATYFLSWKRSIRRYFKKLDTYNTAMAKGATKSPNLGVGVAGAGASAGAKSALHSPPGGGAPAGAPGAGGVGPVSRGSSRAASPVGTDGESSTEDDSSLPNTTLASPGGLSRANSGLRRRPSNRSLATSNATLDSIVQRVNSFLLTNREEGLGWEAHIAANLQGLTAGELETLWPRDTLFHYLQDMQQLQEVHREFQELQLLASWTLFEAFDT
ncbi:uncharacterized protein AMSG_12160 [Thecamonas trahens ATCC 50062]|uniref:Uracil-DNA glycosylase n=1 Tax=Thecamonas trahens ATCC 50062 TaxID=461836 RepID=A0A0L0DJW0_THETB|nr:hypothetical protein AMSG_12160 [Thecamonas trahens ATCC 50062]KNC52386.1 hypothetical protein AMSG_12160 [Thecamonas trahens ATCC 50062]|eukprot:XP_013755500.1 hypothetical protein AMSG_12160 [Thecamonas trahens ATCC 50062]